MIEFSCSTCGSSISVPDEIAGKKVRCPGCKGVVRAPEAVAAAVAGDDDGPPLDDLLGDILSGGGAGMAAEVDDGPTGMSRTPGFNEEPATRKIPCPHCNQPVAPAAARCSSCGTSFMQPSHNSGGVGAVGAAASVVKAGGGMMAALIAGGVAAAIGGGVWGGIVIATDYEIGWVAWAIGAFAGFAVAIATGGTGGLHAGTIAAASSLAGLALGKILIFQYYTSGTELADTPLVDQVAVLLSPWDLLWAGLAVVTAFRVGAGLGAGED